MLWHLLLLLALSLIVGRVAPAGAQPMAPPACGPAAAGMVACLGDKLCECRFEPGGSLAGRPTGHRWDCGVLRPACGVVPPRLGQAPPPTLQDLPPLMLTQAGPMPDGGAATRRGQRP